jgi:hypothetical protein
LPKKRPNAKLPERRGYIEAAEQEAVVKEQAMHEAAEVVRIAEETQRERIAQEDAGLK